MAQHNPLSVHADPLASKKEAWSGRFSEPMAEFVLRYTASVNFDKRMAEADIAGSVAHAKMLAKCGIISKEDLNDIERGMRQILQEIKENRFEWKLELEDVHLNIEARLTELVGDAGKRLHTGRSRNDQVALDIRLYLRNEIDQIMDLLSHLQKSLLTVAEKNIDTIMPGYTHMQVAQPVTLGHHCLAYAEMFERDRERLADCRKRVNRSPLGAAALAGTTYPIDREYTAELLGFEGVTQNSLDSVSDRDFAIEFCSCASLIMIHISRMSEELLDEHQLRIHHAAGQIHDGFLHHAAEKESGRSGSCPRQVRTRGRSPDGPSDADEGTAPCLQQRQSGRQRAAL